VESFKYSISKKTVIQVEGEIMRKEILIAVVVIVLIIGVVLGYAVSTLTAPPTVTGPTGLQGEILIGSPLALTGAFGSFGTREKYAIEIAQSDINEFITRVGLPVKFTFLIEDTETKPDVALSKVQAFAAKGVKVLVGGFTSGELRGIGAYVESNKIVTLASASTADRKSIGKGFDEGSYIIRTLPSCEAEGVAMTKAILNMGYKKIAIITAKVTYSEAIERAFISEFEKAGGEVVYKISYEEGTKTFTSELSLLEAEMAKYAKDEVALFANMWEDVALFLQQAEGRNSPLLGYTWFGPDTYAYSTVVLNEAGTIAAKVKLISVNFEAPVTERYLKFVEAFKNKVGETPDIYAIGAYDNAWIAVLSILAAGKYDGEAIRAVVPYVANHFYGVLGNPALLPNGDRENMDQAFYAIKIVAGKPDWVRVALYESVTGKLTWMEQI
jgi:branched-chain amino acid transport system substrate-binding protein